MRPGTSHSPPPGRVLAVLGPTNTGKTHLAMERMLAHSTGMIGFPLRLLARENYDRAVRIKGSRQVALITGEEKIVPDGARYFLCTTESMPVDRPVAFLGIDEIQMCADPDRGHVFTARLLDARGTDETMLMGAGTVRPLIRQLVPDAEFATRPRLSTLTHTGVRKTTRLAPRSAVVAFSAAEVYANAELVRRQRGGAAVVLGALSPRARNAQVAMYQAGEVDYLVATDAIGMGLNMDIDHVAFAGLGKFDGRRPRRLSPAELAQIAGRAGRHMNDGTFGTTTDAGPIDPEVVERIENHRFKPLSRLFWRNPRLRFTSLRDLSASLAVAPARPGLVKVRKADDELVLEVLARDSGIARLAATPDAVRLLWEVCQVPDFGKVMSDAHARLLGRVYRYLMGEGGGGRLPVDWVADQVARLERVDGDIETLVQRIANIRTWTYVSYRADWLDDAGHWQERTRGIEDRLSDALHERLTQRFVDRRAAVLVSRMKERRPLLAAVDGEGGVAVEGHHVGHLSGFRFVADKAAGGDFEGAAARAVGAAAMSALRSEVAARVARLEADADDALTLSGDTVSWRGEAVARLVAGPQILKPGVEPLAGELLGPEAVKRVRRRLSGWLEGLLERRLGPLLRARRAPLDGAARGLVFQLGEALGSLPRRVVDDQLAALGRDQRKELRRLGVRIGRQSVFMPALLKPAPVALRALLWALARGVEEPPPPPGRVSVAVGDGVPRDFYEAVGYRPLGRLALRVDMVERLAARAWTLSRGGPFEAGPELLSLAGCGQQEMTEILAALGYRAKPGGEGEEVRFVPRRRPGGAAGRDRGKAAGSADSPFAKLRDHAFGR